MSRQVSELEAILQQLIDEHRKLIGHVDAQQVAMKSFDLKAMDDVVRLQDAARIRISGLETRRRAVILAIARAHRMNQALTLPDVAAMFPAQAANLLKLRDELKETI